MRLRKEYGKDQLGNGKCILYGTGNINEQTSLISLKVLREFESTLKTLKHKASSPSESTALKLKKVTTEHEALLALLLQQRNSSKPYLVIF